MTSSVNNRATGKTALLVGFVGENKSRPGREVTNSVALLQHGRIAATRSKTLLPTYDVFDEDRYFEPAADNAVAELNGRKIGLTICEDLWNDEDFWPVRRSDQSAGRAGRSGRGDYLQCFRLTLASWEEQDPFRNAPQPRPQDQTPGGVLQPGRRQ